MHALRQINLARGPDQLARAGAGQMAALADGRVDAERARVAAGELHLIGRAARAEDGDVLDRALRSDDGQALMAGIDAGVGQVLARLQLVARAASYDGNDFLSVLEEGIQAGKTVVLTTQVQNEGSNVGVYQVGHKIRECPQVLEAFDMTTEAITGKLMWIEPLFYFYR